MPVKWIGFKKVMQCYVKRKFLYYLLMMPPDKNLTSLGYIYNIIL